MGVEPVPVSPSLGPPDGGPRRAIDGRTVRLAVAAIPLGVAAALLARALISLIALVTNLAFFGRWSDALVSPAGTQLGPWLLLVPIVGGLIVGAMARYGSEGIRGHGIPEAMEQVLVHGSRIPPRLLLLKPLSAAVAIGSGGPFGAEGPIIATGGALGSLIGQMIPSTAAERKTLLAAGAAAGMAATFGTPVAAVFLAVELLLFELRASSLLPVAIASVSATAARALLFGTAAVFPMRALAAPGPAAVAIYIALGAIVGVAAAVATRATYAVEDLFARSHVHWMWWPALGAIAVGIAGLIAPRTLGVGYDVIDWLLTGHGAASAIALIAVVKLAAWSISLGSGTSGGTLAPLFTIGGGAGALLGLACVAVLPAAGVDPRMAALVGMAAMFAGASRAFLTSVLFAMEATHHSAALLPLLGGCAASWTVSFFLLRESIMTEKIARRGVRVSGDLAVDWLTQVPVRDAASATVVALRADDPVADVRARVEAGAAGYEHQGWPVVDADGTLRGVLTRRDFARARSGDRRPLRALLRGPAITVFADASVREAADRMVATGVGRLPVVTRADPAHPVGMLTRSDVLAAHRRRLDEALLRERVLRWHPLALHARRLRIT